MGILRTLFIRGVGVLLLATVALRLALPREAAELRGLEAWIARDAHLAGLIVPSLIALVLLAFPRAWLAWLLAALTFAAYGAISLAVYFTGGTSCGCLGRLGISPLWTFALAAAVLGGILLLMPLPRACWRGKASAPESLARVGA